MQVYCYNINGDKIYYNGSIWSPWDPGIDDWIEMEYDEESISAVDMPWYDSVSEIGSGGTGTVTYYYKVYVKIQDALNNESDREEAGKTISIKLN